jgi:cytochrome c nitrite reductase small subunit
MTPDAIRVHPETKEILQGNCIRCHGETVAEIMLHDLDRNCWECHRDVAHGERGITLLPMQDSLIYPVEEKRGLE